MNKRKVAIIAGGDSSEWTVSLRSAEGLMHFIDDLNYTKYLVVITGQKWEVRLPDGSVFPINKDDFSFEMDFRKITFDFAYITIHGTPGENGLLQGYLSMLNIPFSGCGVLASALTFDKFMCNQFCRGLGIKVADSLLLNRADDVDADAIVSRLGLPCFVKPVDGGSSFGVARVEATTDLEKAVKAAFNEGSKVMVEALLQGTEITCGLYKTKAETVIFPITEVVTSNAFFDYDAKYNGQVDEITPARIPEAVAKKVRQVSSKIYDEVQARGIVRIDYIIDQTGEPYMIEINTTPGMTGTSFIPQQIKAAGLDIAQVMRNLIESHF